MAARSLINEAGHTASARPRVIRHLRSGTLSAKLSAARLLVSQGQYYAAATELERLLAMHPRNPTATEMLASIYLLSDGARDALPLMHDAIVAHPDDLQLQRATYRTAVAAGDKSSIEASLRAIARLDTADGKSLEQLGNIHRRAGRIEQAAAHYRAALERDHLLLGALQNLSGCLIELRRLDEAIQVLERATQRFGRLPDLHYNLGLALELSNRHEAAAAAYSRAVERNPRYLKALSNLGNVLRVLRKYDAAETSLRTALRQQSDLWAAHINLGNVQKEQGLLEEAHASYRTAAQLQPHEPVVWSNLIALSPFMPHQDRGQIAHLCSRFDATVTAAAPVQTPVSPRAGRTRIRIGYVSADFREHVGNYFVEPVLDWHDRTRFDIFCYDNNARPDRITERLQRTDSKWRPIAALTDAQVATMVQEDQIDVLVDLMGHTIGHRLGVFAHKPATVQVKWRGFPGSSGLSTMDYWITDRHIAADDCPEDYRTEALLALPDLERCFRPDEDCPQVSPAPVARKGAITFASFHAAYKLNDEVLELWGTLLNLVPQAELLIVSVPKGKAQARVLRILSAHGVAPERVRMYPRVSLQEFFALHSQADVNLDAFPFCGVTTTLQGLWMGVPTLTLQGARYSARVGASIMANLGLRAFIAHSAAEYVKKACELASDPLELVRLRSTMRPRMLASPILDERRFTRELEAVYLRCLGNSPLERSGLLGDGGWLKLY